MCGANDSTRQMIPLGTVQAALYDSNSIVRLGPNGGDSLQRGGVVREQGSGANEEGEAVDWIAFRQFGAIWRDGVDRDDGADAIGVLEADEVSHRASRLVAVGRNAS